jgi:adenylate cyclase
MGELWRRLRERRLFQWVAAYLAGAWLLVQVAHLVGEQFGLSGVLLRSITATLAVGLLAAAVLAWYHGEQGRQRVTGIELVMLGGILVLAASSVAMVRHAAGDTGGAAPGPGDSGAASLQPFPVARERSIAVLPFTNMSEERDNEHFSDGLTEELLMDLARVTSLRVISRTSVMRFKESDRSVREIGDELGVAYVVSGSVRRDGNRLRITTQLIDARTDQHVWGNSYDSDLRDIFTIQRNIASQIASSLRAQLPALSGGSPAQAGQTSDMQAYQLFLEGRTLFHNRFGEGGRERLVRGADLLQQAVDRDPDFARAWAGLALAYAALGAVASPSSHGQDGAVTRAEAAAGRALALDSVAADAWVARGMLRMRQLQWADAEHDFLRALAAEPQNAPAHDAYGMLLVSVGRSQEAERVLRRSAELDPINARTLHWLADALRNSGRLEESRFHAQRSMELGMFTSSIGVYLYHLHRKDVAGAAAFQREALQRQGYDAGFLRPVLAAVEDAAQVPAALAAARESVAASPALSTIIYAFYFDFPVPEPALDAMDAMVNEGEGMYAFWRMWEPGLTHLRNHRRFLRLAERAGLVEYWRAMGWPDLCRPEGRGFSCR